MNKNVFEYLNGKANDVKDYIVAKAEAAGNFLSDHAQDIKTGLVKGTATVLTTAMLLGGMTGCTPNNNQTEEYITPTLNISDFTDDLRSRQEIEQTGITEEDVLDAIDCLAINCFIHDILPRWQMTEEDLEKFYSITYEFDSIAPKTSMVPTSNNVLANMESRVDPFYFKYDSYSPDYPWIKNDIVMNNVYPIYFNYTAKLGQDKEYCTIENFGIYKEDFENIMKAFNIQGFTLTQEHLDSLGSAGKAYSYWLGSTVYPGTTIDRQMIENANPEQLWAIYNAITNSMYSINFDGNLPDNNPEQN